MAAEAGGPRYPRVVIIGGGFGGIEVAKALARAPVAITLIDRQNHHCFQPLLYQVATAALSPAEVAWPIRGLLGRQSNTTVLMADVTAVDPAARCVTVGTARIGYDYLVLATGATHSYFGHDDWAQAAPGLKTMADALGIRRRVLSAFERAELAEDEGERQRLTSFVIVGGGPTGVELAGAIAELARDALPLDFHHVDPRRSRIVLVEAGPRILPAFPAHLSGYAQQALEKMGVEVRIGARVTGCDAGGVDLGPERLAAATVLWAAGVRASPAARWLGVASDKAGRILVGPDLSVPEADGVFAIGDTAAVQYGGQPVPGIAPAAKQMGRYVGELIAARVGAGRDPGPFRYRHQGDLATIGRKAAVVRLGRIELRGFIGWVAWSIVHIYFLIGTRNRLTVALTWLWNYLTYQRAARLITESAGPHFPDEGAKIPP